MSMKTGMMLCRTFIPMACSRADGVTAVSFIASTGEDRSICPGPNCASSQPYQGASSTRVAAA